MKKIVFSFFVIISGISLVFYFLFYKKSPELEQVKEATLCGSIPAPSCNRYRCITGYLVMPPPPGGSARCTDGSPAQNLGEVPTTNTR